MYVFKGKRSDYIFYIAYKFMIKHEGFQSNDIYDKGGVTRYGISLRFLKANNIDINHDGIINEDDIQSISIGLSKDIYENYFFTKPNLYLINKDSIIFKCFDFCVNIGTSGAIKLLQKSINKVLSPKFELSIDGIIGQKTVNTISQCNEDQLLKTYCDQMMEFYNNIIKNNPSQKKYKKGWERRAYDLEFYS